MSITRLPHEDEAHLLAMKLARKVARSRWPSEFAGLQRQIGRSSSSVALNCAEAAWKGGEPGKYSYRIALGELGETAAGCELGGIRCWRPIVERLRVILIERAGCDVPGSTLVRGLGCPAPPSSPPPPPAPAGAEAQGKVQAPRRPRRERRRSGGEFPPGNPFTYEWPKTDRRAGGFPYTPADFEMRRRWVEDWLQRRDRGEFDDELCHDEVDSDDEDA